MGIQWDETLPLDSQPYAGFPTAIISLKTAISTGLSVGMEWPSSDPNSGTTTNAGSMRSGTFLADTLSGWTNNSQFSFPSLLTSGRLFVVTGGPSSEITQSYLLGQGASVGTLPLGTNAGLEAATFPAAGRWVVQSGALPGMSQHSLTLITYPSAYSGIPTLILSSDATRSVPCVIGVSPTTAYVALLIAQISSTVTTTIYWQSFGTMA